MSKKTITPTNKEAQFEEHEIFFSQTNEKGTILDGNAVFIRVSGYPRATMINSPHNMVRHPDTPKTIFKLFWESLENKKPIVAFIKNLTAQGSYYWVLAYANPIEGGYVSIRIKPQESTVQFIDTLYKKILDVEKSESMTKAKKLLLKELFDAGYDSYVQFMTNSLLSEIVHRVDLRSKSQNQKILSTVDFAANKQLFLMGDIYMQGRDLTKSLSSVFQNSNHFLSINKRFMDRTKEIMVACRRLKNISINMSLLAEKLGSSAGGMVVVASFFQNMVDEVMHRFASFQTTVSQIQELMLQSMLGIGASQMQIEMIMFCVQESTEDQNSDQQLSNAELTQLAARVQMLTKNAHTQTSSLTEILLQLETRLNQFREEGKLLKSSIVGLEVVRQSGQVEAQGVKEIEQFKSNMTSMKEFIDHIGGLVGSELHAIDTLTLQVSGIVKTLFKASGEMDTMVWNASKLAQENNHYANIQRNQIKEDVNETIAGLKTKGT